jgi:hypothetical protein
MSYELFNLPGRAANSSNGPYNGAKLYFYQTGTLTPQTVYQDAELTVAHSSPVLSDEGGKFPAIYFDRNLTYRVRCYNSSESELIHDIDPVNASFTIIVGGESSLFENLEFFAIDATSNILVTLGYSVVGRGSGTYVNDEYATSELAEEFPAFCKADKRGRYFRLVPIGGSISVDQGGALGTGNDQPAIQATIDYAARFDIPKVIFEDTEYDLWCPLIDPEGPGSINDGIYMRITKNVQLEGNRGGTLLRCLNSEGGTNDVITQQKHPADSYPQLEDSHRGCGIRIVPNGNYPQLEGDRLEWFGMSNLIIDGTRTYTGDALAGTHANTYSDLTHKGFASQDVYVDSIDIRDCEIRNFAGEIIYLAGSNHVRKLYVENLWVHGSHQCAWNPGALTEVMAVNLKAGDAYQAAEVIGGHHEGHTYIGGLFYNSYSTSFLATSYFTNPQPYTYTQRDNDEIPPWVTFVGTRFEACNTRMYGWQRGEIHTVDSPLFIPTETYSPFDINLKINAWCDRLAGSEALGFGPPADDTTQFANATAGIFYRRQSCIDIRLHLQHTQYAKANNIYWNTGVRYYPGVYDHANITVSVSGAAGQAFECFASEATPIPSTFGLPLTHVYNFHGVHPFVPDGGKNYNITSSQNIKPISHTINFFQNDYAAGTYDIGIDLTYDYVQGQRIMFSMSQGKWNGSTWETILNFAKNGTGMMLNSDATLRRPGEFLLLEFDTALNGGNGAFKEVARLSQGA